MTGPTYNYFNIRDNLNLIDYSGCITFGDNDLYISSSADGTLNLGADTKIMETAPTVELEASTGITLDGDITVDGAHTFTAGTGLFTVGTGGITTTGDLTQKVVKYISGVSIATTPTGFTRCTNNLELLGGGVALLSGKSGQITPKLPTARTTGKVLHMVYIHSGIAAANTAVVSSSGYRTGDRGLTKYSLTFTYPGDACSVVSDGTYWYPISPSGGKYSIFS